tara:strand:- start:876 stop:2537 length:1662 start_codon:yes stop_codon:yes gene_type:complete
MEPRFRLPKNILNGIGQIPRFNLDFTKLSKLPTPGFIPKGMSEKFAQQLKGKGIDLADKNYLYQPKINLGAGSRERFISMPQPVSPTTLPKNMGMPSPRDLPSMPDPVRSYIDVDENLQFGDMPITTMPVFRGDPVPFVPPVQTTAPAPAPSPAPQPVTQTGGDAPFAAGIRRIETGLDPLTKQLLFGLDGRGGFIPGAMRAAEKVFFDEQGQPVVIEEQVAGLTPDQLRAQELAREGIGIQDRFIGDAEQAFRTGVGALDVGLERARGLGQAGLGATTAGLGSLLSGIGESEGLIRGTLGAYDPRMTGQFYNPFEQQVVQQTISDIMEQGDKQDMLARAQDIARGGESAFGSRARLGAAERREALGRGLGEAISGIRAGGFGEAQRLGLGEFARQQQAARTAAGSLANLAGSRMAGQQQLAGALSGLGNLESQIGQQRQQSQFGLAGNLSGLGTQAQAARAADVQQLAGFGLQQQALEQQRLDAQRRNQLQAQQAPLAQYQSLAPFVSMAPAGQFQTTTDFTQAPSPMQAALTTGLGAFGAIGNMFNQQRAV